MKKELLMIIVIIGLPTLFIMSFSGQKSTGALTNEVTVLRVERINLYQQFPIITNVPWKTIIYRVRNHLLRGAHDDYYYYYGLGHGHEFFNNEMALVPELLKLMCLERTGFIQEGQFISPGGVSITVPSAGFDIRFKDIGQVPCDPMLADIAAETLTRVIELDFKMVEMTISNSHCQEFAQQSLTLGRENLAQGRYEAVITDLRNAWSKVASCL